MRLLLDIEGILSDLIGRLVGLLVNSEGLVVDGAGQVVDGGVVVGFWETILGFIRYNPDEKLIFNSGLFLFLFVIFSLFYVLLRRKLNARLIYVFLFSLFFYYKSSDIYFLLILLVATTDYFIAHGIHRSHNARVRRWFVALSVVINLGILGYFKYTNFFIGIGRDMFGEGFMEFQNIFLPVGISFFIFQSISYTVDVYRRKIEPLTNWLDYAFFLSFFPQVVAGPVVRAVDFIPQIRKNPVQVSKEMFGVAVFLIVGGLFKKAVISDYISVNFVNRVFEDPLLYSGFENLMGVYGYALQIYCDFSGYSDMAIGLALLMGFKFRENFDSPYKSATITEFWRRWHISLSSWLRDYLYIPLGGNRKGKIRTYINLILTMLLGGLWHGASMKFILWGALHGVALALHKLVMELFSSFKATGSEMVRWRRIIGIIFTFHIVCLGWILFRAESVAKAGLVLSRIFTDFRPSAILNVISGYSGIFLLFAIGYLLHFSSRSLEDLARKRVVSLPLVGKAVLVVGVVWIIMQVKSAGIQPFIYSFF